MHSLWQWKQARQGTGWNNHHYLFLWIALLIAGAICAPQTDTIPPSKEQGYRIEQPGTITFTVGVKISGKVEKPQVIIFLPKEKTLYREESLDHSYTGELSQPLPFTPIVE